jgi:hypothetical protein
MPALPNAPGSVKLTIVQSLAGVSVYNVLHANASIVEGYSTSELNALATAVRAAWVTNVIPLQASTLTLTDVIADDLSSDTGGRGIATGSTAGTGAGSTNPASVCVCWSWKIANRYRGGHPRTYIGAIPNSANSNANTMSSTARNAHAAAAAAVRTAVNAAPVGAGTWILGCLSYYSGGAIRPLPLFRIYTGVSVDDRFDSQRRRLGRDRT